MDNLNPFDELASRRKHLSDPVQLIKQLHQKPELTAAQKMQLEQLENFEAALRSATYIPLPEKLDEKILLNSRIKSRSVFKKHMKKFIAMAASFALISFIALRFLVFTPSSALANDALFHLYHDIEHLNENQHDANLRLNESMHSLGINKTIKIRKLRYASNCHVGKIPGVHLIMEVDSRVYTVLFLPEVKSEKEESFQDDHYHGKIIPVSQGSVIVMGMSKFPLGPAIKEITHDFS